MADSSVPFDTERFISEIALRPSLWDRNREDYMDKAKKRDKWVEVCRIFFDNYDEYSELGKSELVTELQKKWRGLRSSFARELARQKNKRGIKRKTYIYFNLMSFLLPFVNAKPSNPARDSAEEDSEDEQEGHFVNVDVKQEFEDEISAAEQFTERKNITETISNQSAKTVATEEKANPSKKRTNETQNSGPAKKFKANAQDQQQASTDRKIFTVLRKIVDVRNTEKNLDQDEERLFLLSLVSELKKVPDNLKLQIKSDILRCIQTAQVAETFRTVNYIPETRNTEVPSTQATVGGVSGGQRDGQKTYVYGQRIKTETMVTDDACNISSDSAPSSSSSDSLDSESDTMMR